MALTPLPSGKSRHRRMPIAEINVTPMVDVMLVLLIIFMLTANLLASGVPVNLPDSSAKALIQEQEPIQISINAGGDVYIGERLTGMDALPGELLRIAEQQPADNPRQIYLRGDTALEYGRVMKVMGELNAAGLNKIALVTTTAGAANSE